MEQSQIGVLAPDRDIYILAFVGNGCQAIPIVVDFVGRPLTFTQRGRLIVRRVWFRVMEESCGEVRRCS